MKHLFTLLLVLATLARLLAQTPCSTVAPVANSPLTSIDVGGYSSPTFRDLDGDGLLDLVIGERFGTLVHYEQTAPNALSFALVANSPLTSIDVGDFSTPTFTDLDGDGLLDLIIGNSVGVLNHYEQTGSNALSFAPVANSPLGSIDVGSYSTPTFRDLDGDGLLDLIIGESDGNLNHYEQASTSALSFALVTNSPLASIDVGLYSTPTFTDVDGDGLLDLIIGKEDGNLDHYEQTSPNTLSFALVANSPLTSIDVGDDAAPTFTDLDGDGLLDLVIGEDDGNLNHYEQTGVSQLTPTVTTQGQRVQVTGGVKYERIFPPQVVNGVTYQFGEQNSSGLFIVPQGEPYRIVVTDANGCTAVVTRP